MWIACSLVYNKVVKYIKLFIIIINCSQLSIDKAYKVKMLFFKLFVSF